MSFFQSSTTRKNKRENNKVQNLFKKKHSLANRM